MSRKPTPKKQRSILEMGMTELKFAIDIHDYNPVTSICCTVNPTLHIPLPLKFDLLPQTTKMIFIAGVVDAAQVAGKKVVAKFIKWLQGNTKKSEGKRKK